MPRTVATGIVSFEEIRKNQYFYIDKTGFISRWWMSGDFVTLITRPRRFGKTLMLDTVRTFFSPESAGREDLFTGLEVLQNDRVRALQGRIPVISVSFADIREKTYADAIRQIKMRLDSVYDDFSRILDPQAFSEREKRQFDAVQTTMDDTTAKTSLFCLAKHLVRQKHEKPIILLDEYDTPLQDAWLNGYFDELVHFMQGFFNSTFKTNPYLGRGLISGITRVSRESVFSDMNNLRVAGITSEIYADCFGFTENEVYTSMDEYGLHNREDVKKWYNGFIFGNQKDIYNPWSIICYLSEKKLLPYWAGTSSNALVGDLIARGDTTVKEETERLLCNESVTTRLDEHLDFNGIYTTEGAVWSLLMAAGYVKPLSCDPETEIYEITLTNLESRMILTKRIAEWFGKARNSTNKFIHALVHDDLEEMNTFMNDISRKVFSYFDIRNQDYTGESEKPENFYHAFVLGLIVDLKHYEISSNGESGYGRYDIMMIPENPSDHGIIIEFKIYNHKKEKDLNATCRNALRQIYEKEYSTKLNIRGIASENIYVYAFSFRGKYVEIQGGNYMSLDWKEILNTDM